MTVHSPSVIKACCRIKGWHDNNDQPCPIYKPYDHPIVNYMLEHELIRFTGMARSGPLGVYTGEHCFRLTEAGLALCEGHHESKDV